MDENNVDHEINESLVVINGVTTLSSDTDNPQDNSANEDGTTIIEHNSRNVLDKIDVNVTNSCSNKHETDVKICDAIHIAQNNAPLTCVEINNKDCAPLIASFGSDTESTCLQDKNQNQLSQNNKIESCHANKTSNGVETNNYNKNVNSTENDISKYRSFFHCWCSKLRNILARHKTEPREDVFIRSHTDLGEAGADNYLDRFYVKKIMRTTNQRNCANFKERVKGVIHQPKMRKNPNNVNPLRRTYHVYFGELTDGGIEYDPETFNFIVPIVLATVFILLVLTAVFNVSWYETLFFDEWRHSTNDPAVLCVFSCLVILVVDITFSFVAVARHPFVTWICLVVVWACVQFITFYIGNHCRSIYTDNVLIVIVTPTVITSLVVFEFLWMSIIKADLTGDICPYTVTIIWTIVLLAVMTGITYGALKYEVHEMVICWLLTLYYVISMLVLLQMILTQRIYEMNEYDVALPAMLLFISPYSLITNLIRYFAFAVKSESEQ